MGDNARIAAGAVVLGEVPPNATAVGVPAQVVRVAGKPVYYADDVDQIHMTDPLVEELAAMNRRVEELEPEYVSAKILEEWENKELPARIHLFQGLPKGDKMELIIQKAVELGAYRVVPVSMKRSVVKLDAKKADAKRKRWNAVSESAAKQSKRSLIPEVAPLMNYKEAVKEAAGYDMVLLPYESADGIRKTRELLASVKPGTDIAVFIGPEDEEVELARENGAEIVTLGKRILRTETAGLCMLSALMLQLEV